MIAEIPGVVRVGTTACRGIACEMWGGDAERLDADSCRIILSVSIGGCMGTSMTRDLIHRGDNERLVFSEPPLPQLTDIRVEGTYQVSLSEGGEPDEAEAFECDPNTSPAQARDYIVAAASGALVGALSVLWQKDLNLADARKFGAEKIEKIVIGAAQRAGLTRENPGIEDAIRLRNPQLGAPPHQRHGGLELDPRRGHGHSWPASLLPQGGLGLAFLPGHVYRVRGQGCHLLAVGVEGV